MLLIITIEKNMSGGISTPFGLFKRTYEDNEDFIESLSDEELEKLDEDICFYPKGMDFDMSLAPYRRFDLLKKWQYVGKVTKDDMDKIREGFNLLDLALKHIAEQGKVKANAV